MEKTARTHFITLCKRALEASNWTGFDVAHLVGDSHVVCFQSTADTGEKRRFLGAVVDLVNRQFGLHHEPDRSGIVVFDSGDSGDSGDSAHSPGIVGVIEADPKALERQYNHIRNILKPLGLCEGFAKRLYLDEDPTRQFTITTTSSNKDSHTSATKVVASIGKLFKGITLSGETSTSKDVVSSEESTHVKKTEVDHGAVRSALFMNMICKDLGVSDLKSITTRDEFVRSCRKRADSESLHLLKSEAENFEAQREIIQSSMIGAIEGVYRNLALEKSLYETHKKDSWAMNLITDAMQNLGEAAREISQGVVNADTLENLYTAHATIESALKEKYMAGALDYCMHGAVLMACFNNTRQKILDAHADLKAQGIEETATIDSSSLPFSAYVKPDIESSTSRSSSARRP